MPTEFLPQIWVTSWTNRDVLKWSISHQSLNVTSCQDFSEKTLQNGGVFKVGPLRLRRLFSCYLVRGGGRQVLSAQSQNSRKNWRKKTSVLLPIEKLLRFSKQIVALLKKRGDQPPFIPQEVKKHVQYPPGNNHISPPKGKMVKVHEGIFDASAGASSAASEPSAIDLWKVLPTETRKQFRVEEDLFGSGSTISQFPWKYSNPKDWSTKNWHQICLFETQTHGNINLRSQKAGRKNFGAKVLKIKSFQKFPKYYHLLPPRKTCLGMQYQNTILVCTGCKTRVLWQKVPKISLSVEVPWSSRWEWFISIICIGSWRLVRGPTTIMKIISSDWHPWYGIPPEVERICHSTITLMTIQYCNTSRHQKSINFCSNCVKGNYNFLGPWI